MTSLFGIFGTPSFTPLTNHMSLVLDCTNKLNQFFKAVINQNWDEAQKLHNQINELENKADQAKEDIRLNMPKSYLMSVERTDILDILALQDRIANKAKHLSGVVLSRKMKIPTIIEKDFLNFVSHAIETVTCLSEITSELQTLFDSNFRRKEAGKMESLIHQLDKIEDKTDHYEIQVRDQVFNIEDDLKPIDAIFLYKTLDWVSDLADRSQRCAHRFLMLIAH